MNPPGYPPGYPYPPGQPEQQPGMYVDPMYAHSLQGRQADLQATGYMLGSGAASAIGYAPAAMYAGAGMVGMAAPFLSAGFRSSGTMRGAVAANVVRGMDFLDPTTFMFHSAKAGYRIGGSLGRFGRVGAVIGGATGLALPIAASMAVTEGLAWGGRQMAGGAQDAMYGQALMNQIGPTALPGQNISAEGNAMGTTMRSLSEGLDVGMEDLSRYAHQLNAQKVFQATRSAKEFRSKFSEVMKAVKEISKMTQSTVDDAMNMFSELRQQGFYTTADIKAQAASRQAREATTGISSGVYSAIGGVGAQTARQYGMRGRFGAEMMERSVAGVSMGVRSGIMSEEEVMEMGGVEAVGMRLAQRQMGFLGTARGRAMIGYAMGEGGAPDPTRLTRLLTGESLEGVVTGAAGRGLGVMRAAGSREAREQFAQYAPMAMVSMALKQQQQLGWGQSYEGALGMLGTMGVGREEARVMFAQTMGMTEQLRAEATQATNDAAMLDFERRERERKISTRFGNYMRDLGMPLRQTGAALSDRVRTRYSLFAGGDRLYTTGGLDLGARYLAEGGDLGMGGLGRRGMGDLRREYDRDLVQLSSVSPDRLASGEVIPVSRTQALDRATVTASESAYVGGMEKGISEGQEGALAYGLRSRGGLFGQKQTGFEREMRELKKQSYVTDTKSMSIYAAAVTSGLIDKSEMSYRDFMKKDVGYRSEVEGQIRTGLEKLVAAGGSSGVDAERLLYDIGTRDVGMLGARDISGVRSRFREMAEEALGAGGMFGVLRTGRRALARHLTENGQAAAAYDEAIREAHSDSPDPTKLQAALQKLEASGLDSDTVGAITRQLDKIQAMSPEERRDNLKTYSEGLGSAIGQKAAAELLMTEKSRAQGRLKNVNLDSIKDEGLRSALKGIAGSAGLADYQASSKKLMQTVLSDSKVSTEELSALRMAGREGEAAFFEALGSKLSDEDISTSSGMSKEDVAAARKALKEGDAEALGRLTSGMRGIAGEGLVTGEGSELKYKEANTQFVLAVHAFVSALKSKGIDVPDIPGPGAVGSALDEKGAEPDQKSGGKWFWQR